MPERRRRVHPGTYAKCFVCGSMQCNVSCLPCTLLHVAVAKPSERVGRVRHAWEQQTLPTNLAVTPAAKTLVRGTVAICAEQWSARLVVNGAGVDFAHMKRPLSLCPSLPLSAVDASSVACTRAQPFAFPAR